ncbi:DUF1433 domain-containing protein [Bacillus altitudinis]|uniref:DUF1433 domain-containing protein n=1 Tax=Bacillus altitudinis TaxID=293387 RepID=UPI001B82981B|nr:DUF1433 domain-containing protein [Bacillus altitudinis]MBR0577575.1 DUF1433 domain-containing protein [Bacillus altitudinis A23-8]MCY7712743.1 DUF1433 domain-containing protein [Bacillus altitudinis]MEC0969556.1 DUF1433 domain-containing protein [Bacillus altitudinis]MEC1003130.1 DUF1433 domain-containing protein [Bacillus altitudinis]MED4562158.1 DUF1433 domain-containing protein [Bacillus altitudinis]
MKNTIKLVSVLVVIIIVSVTSLITQHNKQSKSNDVVKEKSDQEKAEELAEKMKPKIEECLRKEDIHHFIKTITFKKRVTIDPMGYIVIRGYINDEPEKYEFSASLKYRTKEIGSMSYSYELSIRFRDWEKYKDEPELKENFLKNLSKKEREQYLKDIGEKVK